MSASSIRRIVAGGVAVGAFLILLNAPAPSDMALGAWLLIRRSLAIFALCVTLWVTNALPLMVTSLLPLALFPLLGVLPVRDAYALFGNEVVFFLLGVFILTSAVMRVGLSTRLAWTMLRLCGRSAPALLAATLMVPAFGSFLMSEHAVAAMFFPVVLEVSHVLGADTRYRSFGRALFLALAWGCVIGGVATYLGGGRAPLAAGMLREATGDAVGFLRWMSATFPLVLALLAVAYGFLAWISRDGTPDMRPVQELLRDRRRALGRVSRREKGVAALMAATIIAWAALSKPLGGLAGVALLAVVIAFACGLLNWREVEEDVNWGILLMYGGAIALGFGLQSSGAAAWLSGVLFGGFQGRPGLFVAAMSLLSIGLTECMSNAAVVALLLPLALDYAAGDVYLGRLVTMSIAVPAGLAFCLPMATPAIALAFASGLLRIRDTVGAGVLLAAVAWLLFNVLARVWLPVVGMSGRW
jgi:sodium-dependent dicarboxylate transporter 2/3/5